MQKFSFVYGITNSLVQVTFYNAHVYQSSNFVQFYGKGIPILNSIQYFQYRSNSIMVI